MDFQHSSLPSDPTPAVLESIPTVVATITRAENVAEIPAQPAAPQPQPAVPTVSQILQLGQQTVDLREQLNRLEKDGTDVTALRQAYSTVYSTSDPLRYQMQHDPRFRPFSPLSTDALRLVARTNDIAAQCITHLKREVTKVPLKVVLKDEKDKSRAGRRAIEDATDFLSKRGGLGGFGVRRAVFEAQMCDDMLVIGATALHKQYDTRGARLDGRPSQIKAIDASTIQPLVTPYGFLEGNDKPAFAQWVQGIPCGHFFRDEMIYEGLPSFARSDSPYFMSPTENAAIQIYTLMRVDEWNRTWLTEGSGYRRWLKLNPDVTPTQARAWLEIMELQTQGNAKERHKIGFVPGEITGDESRRDQDFDGYEHSRIDRICLSYGVNPASIGQHSRQYKDSQEGAMDSTREGPVAEILQWREFTYNDLFDSMGWDFLQVTEDIPAPNESPKERTDRQNAQIAGGNKTINQVRAENGDEPIEGGDTLLVPGTLTVFSQLITPPPAPEIPPTDGSQNPGQTNTQKPANGQAGPQNEGDISDDKTARADTETVVERGYQFSCVMAFLGEDAADIVRNYARLTIDEADLTDDGFETEPHVALRYGLHTEDAADVAQLLSRWGRPTISARVGGVSIFDSAETGRPYDVVKLDVSGHDGDLDDVYSKLGELEHTDTHSEYKPHITLAYVRPGHGAKYVTDKGPLSGEWLSFDKVRFSSKNGTMTAINMKTGSQTEIKRVLEMWERKALKRLQRGQRAACNFDTDVLSNAVYVTVATGLTGAGSKDDVRAVFASVRI